MVLAAATLLLVAQVGVLQSVGAGVPFTELCLGAIAPWSTRRAARLKPLDLFGTRAP
jgi:hypothetical protein